MRICSLILLLILGHISLSVAPSWATVEGIKFYITKRGGTAELVTRWTNPRHTLNECAQTDKYMLCIRSRQVRFSHQDYRAEQVELKALSLQARHSLYLELVKKADHSKFKQEQHAEDVYMSRLKKNDSKFILTNVEFFTAHHDNWFVAIASVPYRSSINKISYTYKSKYFSDAYSDNLYPIAIRLFNNNKYNEALIFLKEIHDLKRARADAYILASRTFFLVGKKEDAYRIAVEVLNDLDDQLTLELAEQLGDIFVDLGNIEMANSAFILASRKLNIN